jgi:hypothetical protein
MKTKKEYIASLTSELNEWSDKIDHLITNSETATAELKLRYIEQLNVLRTKELTAIDKIKELEESSGDAWVTVKVTADKIWNDLRVGLADTVSKFS